MKFTVNAGEFDSALKSVQGRARVSTTIPILKHILVTASEAKVSALGNDLDSSSFASLDAEVATDGSWAIPAEPLIRVIGGLLKSAHVVVEFDGQPRQQVIVRSGKSRYTIPVMPAADFPPALSASGGVEFAATSDDLHQLLARPRGAINAKEPRAALTGIFLHDEAGKLAGVATDGHTVLRFGASIEAAGFRGVIVPTHAIDEILKIGSGTLSILPGRTIEIGTENRSYCSKLIDATFPESYRRIIPAAQGAYIEIDREGLLECLSRLDSISSFSDCLTIDASIGAGEISITLTGIADGAETIECDTEHADGEFFCLRTRQLLKACQTLRGDRVQIYVGSDPIRLVDLSEPDAISVEKLCVSKNRVGPVAAAVAAA